MPIMLLLAINDPLGLLYFDLRAGLGDHVFFQDAIRSLFGLGLLPLALVYLFSPRVQALLHS